MAKAIHVCSRNRPLGAEDKLRLMAICKALTPDNLPATVPHSVCMTEQTALGIVNHHPTLLKKGQSLLLGHAYGDPGTWETPLTPPPDGSYAIFRENDEYIELLTDVVATRTLWYYHDDEHFISSTSQRAILLYLGSFVFDPGLIPWMLTNGSLGPSHAWDKRLRRVGPDSSICLDRKRWTLAVASRPAIFQALHRSEAEHRRGLIDVMQTSLDTLKSLDFERWALPLSGGTDSRALLLYFAGLPGVRERIKTVTWGLKESLGQRSNDAYVAKELATQLQVSHRYYHTNISDEPLERIITRFLVCGEGRIDHLPGYMDGFYIWKTLYEEGVVGTIRGDEGFGWSPAAADQGLRHVIGCTLYSDYANTEDFPRRFGLAPHEPAQELSRKNGESVPAWRDRLYHTYRIPVILAALSDLKLPFVEQISPLLARPIVECTRTLPDHLRTDKALFRKIVSAMSPSLHYATESASADMSGILRQPGMVALLRESLRTDWARRLFAENFLTHVADQIETRTSKPTSAPPPRFAALRRHIPLGVKSWLRRKLIKPSLDGNALAFRVFLIVRMCEMLDTPLDLRNSNPQA